MEVALDAVKHSSIAHINALLNAIREFVSCGHNVLSSDRRRYPHNQVVCQKKCYKQLVCGHSCIATCSVECRSDCSCDSNQGIKDGTIENVIVPTPDVPKALQAFREYADGGHTQADQTTIVLAEQQRPEGDGMDWKGLNLTEDFTMLRVKDDGNGRIRSVYRETYNPRVPQPDGQKNLLTKRDD